MTAATEPTNVPLEGGRHCRHVRYRMQTGPLFVHGCRCRWCQRESGASFALHAMIEAHRLASTAGAPELVRTPSASGRGQDIARCPHGKLALWSHYAGAGPLVSFVRVGTLDQPDLLPQDISSSTFRASCGCDECSSASGISTADESSPVATWRTIIARS